MKTLNKRLFPAVDLQHTQRRLATSPETLNRMWILRRYITEMTAIEAMEMVQSRMRDTVDNVEFLASNE